MSRDRFLIALVIIMAMAVVMNEHLILSQPVIVVMPAQETQAQWTTSTSPSSQTSDGALPSVALAGTFQESSGSNENSPTPGQPASTDIQAGTTTLQAPAPNELWQTATIPPEQVNHILCVHGSPACGMGQQFYDAMVTQGIDPALALGFFGMESSYGISGVAVATRGIGNIRCGVGHDYCIDGFRAFQTWEEGFRYWSEFMTNEYKSGAICRFTSSPCDGALTTIDEIIRVYAPGEDNNCEQCYTTFVTDSAERWRAANRAGTNS